MKIIILLVLLGLMAVNCVLDKEEFKCDVNLSYQENDCNNCTCGPKGDLAACTAMACLAQFDPKHKDCEVGTTWSKDCNKCWCVKNLGTVCTVSDC